MTSTNRNRQSGAAVKPPRHGRVHLRTLVQEELRALPRNTFALATVAIVLGIFAPLGAFAYGGELGVGTLVFTWLVAELAVAIAVAVRVAGARRSRFVDSLYTTPLEQRTWIAAQAIVGCVLVLAVLVAQLPFLLVHVAWLGIPSALPALLLAALGVGLYAVALGLFSGVIVGDSSATTAAGLAGGLGFVAFALFIMHLITLDLPPTPTAQTLLRVTALSPLTLMIGGTGIGLTDVVPADPWRPYVGLAGLVVGLGGAAGVAYTAAQTPLGWDRRRSRYAVAALALFAVLTPFATAEVVFIDEEDDQWPLVDPGEYTQVAFVSRGAPIHDKSFTLSAVYGAPDLIAGKPMEVDALVLARVPDAATVRDVRIQIHGSDSVNVEDGGILVVPDGEPHGHAPPGRGWDTVTSDPPRPVYRVPVTLRAIGLVELGESPALVEVHTQFRTDGEPLRSVARMVLDAEVEGAVLQLFGAGLVFPSIVSAGLIVRRHRTR